MIKGLSRQQIITGIFVAVTAAGVTLFVAAAVQQSYRQTADDPQIQMSDDASTLLNQGTSPLDVVGGSKVDMSSSLAPFVMVFDANHKLVATNESTLSGQVPTPPIGTFDYAKEHGQERFTWQTATGNRYATILTYSNGAHPGYVLAARSLLEVEKREDALRIMALTTLAGVAAVCLVWAVVIRLV